MLPADFRTAFPAFVNSTDAAIQPWITASLPYFDASTWGDRAAEGQGYWIAHMLTINAQDSASAVDANDVTSRDTEHLRISRSPELLKAQAMDPMMRTVWGQRYRYLARLIGMGPLVGGGGVPGPSVCC